MLNIKYLFALIGLMAAIAFFALFRSNADQKPVEESSCIYQNLKDGQWIPIKTPTNRSASMSLMASRSQKSNSRHWQKNRQRRYREWNNDINE